VDKYIGFDIDNKKTVACVVQKGERDRYTTFKTDRRNTQGTYAQETNTSMEADHTAS
jgi:hypothetical protein